MSLLLDVNDLSIAFGGLKAVSDVSLKIERGSLHGLIGPNGAGKTTCFNLLTGVYKPTSGSVHLDGQRVDGMRPSRIAAAGLARTFQNIRLFADLSVIDNVRVACHLRTKSGFFGAAFRTRRHVGEERAIDERAKELLALLNLDRRANERAGDLPYGDQRRLEIARALAAEPKALLLDEPAAGMNTQEKRQLRDVVRDILTRFDLAILLIDHDMGLVMNVCDRVTVLDHGVVICCDEPDRVQNDPRVIEAYLGEPATKSAEDPSPAKA
jgi:branched-chain amino acid transport system ATP-binding protein